jgi:FkbM family methyltransferase
MRLALDSQAHQDRLKEIKDRILVASHLTAEKDGLELWDTPKGPYWIPKGNRYVLPFNLAEMEAHIYGSGEHFVRAGDVVLDCGASALPLNVDDQNFAANSVVFHAPGVHPTLQAQLTTIDQIVNELAQPRVDFIKMDIEGAEVNALHGARETLRRFRPRLAIAMEHKPDEETAIPNAVRAVKSDYQAECGYCAQSNGYVHPEVMYFY